jgi:hypothetical protein
MPVACRDRPQNRLTPEQAAAKGRAGGTASGQARHNSAKWRAINRALLTSNGKPQWPHLVTLYHAAYHAGLTARIKRQKAEAAA